MVRVANPSHVKAARLRESGIEWSIALEKAKVPDTDLTRMSVRRVIRELVSTAKAEAQAERDAADAELRAKRKDLKAGGAEAGRCRRRRRGRAGSAGGVTMTPTRASRGARRGRWGASGAGAAAAAARAMATRRRRFGASSSARGAASGW